VQDERAKKVLQTIEHIQGSMFSTGAQAGAALFQTIDNLRTTYGTRLSSISATTQCKAFSNYYLLKLLVLVANRC